MLKDYFLDTQKQSFGVVVTMGDGLFLSNLAATMLLCMDVEAALLHYLRYILPGRHFDCIQYVYSIYSIKNNRF